MPTLSDLRRYTYAQADKELQGRCKQKKNLCLNTWLHRGHRYDSKPISIQYHSTDIIVLYPNGDTVVNMGGWDTTTTRQRINALLPVNYHLFYSKHGLMCSDGSRYFNESNNLSYYFSDGLTITKQGKVKNARPFLTPAQAKLSDKFNRYVMEIGANLSLPSHADCWLCHVITEKGQVLGDAVHNKKHIMQHVDSGIIVPSLVRNALNFGRIKFNLRVLNKWQEENYLQTYQAQVILYKYLCRKFGVPIL
jgi:hypothetical protein